jgi:hypothetical protein
MEFANISGCEKHRTCVQIDPFRYSTVLNFFAKRFKSCFGDILAVRGKKRLALQESFSVVQTLQSILVRKQVVDDLSASLSRQTSMLQILFGLIARQ